MPQAKTAAAVHAVSAAMVKGSRSFQAFWVVVAAIEIIVAALITPPSLARRGSNLVIGLCAYYFFQDTEQ